MYLEANSCNFITHLDLFLLLQDWDFALNTNNALSRDEVTSTVKVQYDTGKEANFDLSLNKKMSSPLKMTAVANLEYPGRKMTYEETLEETEPGNYNHNLKMQYDPYTTFEVDSTFKSQPRFEVMGSIKTPSWQPITIEGHLKPDLKDFQSRAFIHAVGQPHSLDLSWQHRPIRAGFSSNAEMEFQYHQQKVTANGQLTKKNSQITSSFETKWDALKDESKRISVTSEIEASAAPSVQVKATWWPRSFIEVNGNFKNEKPGYWSSYGDVEGHLDVKSSLRFVS